MKKKFRFIISLLMLSRATCTANDAFKYLDLYTGASIEIPSGALDGDNADFVPYASQSSVGPEEQPSIKSVSSAKLVCSPATVFAAYTTQRFSLSSAEQPSFSDGSFVWGLSLHASSRFIPCRLDVLAGTLRFSQSSSRLKNPLPSLSSALRRPSPLKPSFTASLPTRSASSTAPALFLSLQPTSHRLPALQAMYTLAGEWLAGTSATCTLCNGAVCSAGVTGGMFFVENAGSSGWFTTTPRYPRTLQPAVEAACTLTTALFRTTAAFTVHARPYGSWSFDSDRVPLNSTLSTNGTIVLGPFALSGVLVRCDGGTVTSDGTVLHTTALYALIPQYTFSVCSNPLRIGLLGELEDRTTATAAPQPYRLFKCRLDTDYRTGTTTLSFHTGTAYSPLESVPTYNTGASCTHRFSALTATLSAATSTAAHIPFAPDAKKTSSSVTVSAYGGSSVRLSAIARTSFSTADGDFSSGSTAFQLTVSGRVKRVRLSGKVAFLFTF